MQRHAKGVKRRKTMSLASESFSSASPEAMPSKEGPEWFLPSEDARKSNHCACIVSFNTETLDLNISFWSNSIHN